MKLIAFCVLQNDLGRQQLSKYSLICFDINFTSIFELTIALEFPCHRISSLGEEELKSSSGATGNQCKHTIPNDAEGLCAPENWGKEQNPHLNMASSTQLIKFSFY